MARLWNGADGKQLAELKGDFRANLRVEQVARGLAAAKRVLTANQGDLKTITDQKTAEEKNLTQSTEALTKAQEDLTAKTADAKKASEADKLAQQSLQQAKDERDQSEVARKESETQITESQTTIESATGELQQLRNAVAAAEKRLEQAKIVLAKAQATQPASNSHLGRI